MNLALAALSFFGAVFLPGAIIYKLICKQFCLQFSISNAIISSFIFSICFNMAIIYILVIFGNYTQNILITLTIIEVCLFLYYYKNEILYGFVDFGDSSLAIKILFYVGIFLCLFILNKALKFDIFWAWDSVVSWNRWATEWANGYLVLNDGGYSQIYPMLLSLGYVMSGKLSSFQGIGVSIYWYFMFVGFVASVFILFTKNDTEQSILGLIIAILTYIVFMKMSNEFYIGYVDMPVSMVILISSLCLLKVSMIQSDATINDIVFYLVLGAFCAGISVEIKQAGIFWCTLYVIYLVYLVYSKQICYKVFITCIVVIISLIAPFIVIALYKKWILHIPATNAEYVMEKIYLGKGYLERLTFAVSRYKGIVILFLISLLGVFAKNKIFAFFSITGMAYLLMWGMLLSYDLRNLQGGLPMMIIALGGAIIAFKDKIMQIFKIFNILHKRLLFIFCICIVMILIISLFIQDSVLRKEYNKKLNLGDKVANTLVLDAFSKYGEKIVITSNQLLAFVPNFDRQYYILYHFGSQIKDGEFERYANDFKKEHGSFYILLPNSEFKRYEKFLEHSIFLGDSGHYSLVEF